MLSITEAAPICLSHK